MEGTRATTIPGDRLGPDVHDDALLARLRAGDEVAFQALVDRHRPWLVRFCTRLLGHDTHAGEDAAQESLLKLHAAARRDDRPLRVRPWLTVVARNACVDEQRRRRPDLPGVLPERAVPGHDALSVDTALDTALADAWSRLAGRHREVLYLREVLGFSYKEIGGVMGLTMPATETLVFRARAALRREYDRSGGSAFGCGLLGMRLARLGLGQRREALAAEGFSTAAGSDAGLGGLGSRLAQFLSTSLPGCGEPAMAKAWSVAAGVVMAAASVIPGLAPFAGAAPAAAADAPATVSSPSAAATALPPVTVAAPAGATSGASPVATTPVALKALLGTAVPADWSLHPTRGEAKSSSGDEAAHSGNATRPARSTPLRDAAAPRSADRPERTAHPLREMAAAARPADRPAGATHPLRALLADPAPLPTDPFPTEPPTGASPSGPLPADPIVAVPAPAPAPAPRPPARETVEPVKDAALATFAGHDPALVRRRNR